MIVITEEVKNKIPIKTVYGFRRKGIRYYLFIFSLKIFRVKYKAFKE